VATNQAENHFSTAVFQVAHPTGAILLNAASAASKTLKLRGHVGSLDSHLLNQLWKRHNFSVSPCWRIVER
jgi:hypothetical protein